MKTISRVPSQVSDFVDYVSSSHVDVYIFGADISGKIVKKILDRNQVSVKGFVDNNKNKTDVILDGAYVYHAPDFIRTANKEAVVLIASTYIADIIRQLEDHGFYNWSPIISFLGLYDDSEYRKLLTGELRKNHSGGEFTKDFDAFVLENMKNSQIKYLDEATLYIRSVDIVITEKCSLKCQDCSNLMQYYESPKNIELDSVIKEIDSVTDAADEINELRIIGGDAFMNKDFPEIVNYAASKKNVNKVVIYTNGTIAPNLEKISAIAQSPKIFVFITTYGALSKNAEKLSEALQMHGIQYNNQPAYGWTDCGRIVKHERTETERAKIFQNCCAKHFTTLTDNKIFRCPFAANLHRLGATPNYEDDYIELKDMDKLTATELEEYRSTLKQYLREVAYIKYCDHCNGRTYGDPEIQPGIQTKTPLSYIKIERAESENV